MIFKGQSLCTNVTILKIDLAFLHLEQTLDSLILGDTKHIRYTSAMHTKSINGRLVSLIMSILLIEFLLYL